ncbi:putative DNA repair protein [Flavobacterium enshiense DK69]|uniref:DNA repair protein n=1 Tax=Flavobacterium enshiense DK69 TaxID=1107311 RepID=V6SIW7_9FLAO|nr:JAB domain-containing protein [Flavobacterium enshiense]ESU24365.1 putative DNA repair protein [Flavobacterium enshiense DK69]KGO94470.1 DNA repair protein [Flavobacterium enshiense DK69]
MRKLTKAPEIQVSYKTGNQPKPKIVSPQTSYEVLLESWDMNTIELQEEFKVLLLNMANEVLGVYSMSKGGVSGTVVDSKLLFGVALKCNASNIIICHNHPSSNLKPSINDIDLTKKIKEGADLLSLKLLDHLIICKTGFYSFALEYGSF